MVLRSWGAAAVAACALPLLAEGFQTLPGAWNGAAGSAGRRSLALSSGGGYRRAAITGARMTASKDKVEQASAFQNEAAGEAVCFDGGCMAIDPEHSKGMDMVEAELRELSEVEARLRREGALMLLEKLQEASGGSNAASVPAKVKGNEEEPVEEKDSIIKRKLAGRAGPTVWSEFGALAAETGGVNLGQGFPNWSPPDFVMEAVIDAISKGGPAHQYTRSAGHPPLCALLAARYSMHLGRTIASDTSVAVTVGASQALFMALQTLVEAGDEVLLLEPFFDLYIGQIRLTGATPTYCPLEPDGNKGFKLDTQLLRSKITPKTKVLILNSPHNPTGKVFSESEMEEIAAVVRDFPQLKVISDEVYKYVVHTDGPEAGSLGSGGHVHFARLPDMWDRTLTVSSAGKTFSVTGWQVGWIIGPSSMVRDIQIMLPFVQFCPSTPMQEALVSVLKKADQPYEGEESYYAWLRRGYVGKREALCKALRSAGIEPMISEGGFFVIGDTSALSVPEKYMKETTPAMPEMTRDWALCRWIAKEHGIVGIPCSPFYSQENRELGKNYVRFAFCKTDETLQEAYDAFSKIPQGK